MTARLSLRLPYLQLRAGVRRAATSTLAIALGVALVVAIQLMNGSVLSSFLDTVDEVAGRSNLNVVAGAGVTIPEALVDTVAAIPGVKIAVPLVVADAFPDDGSGELLRVHGVDLTQDAAVRLYRSAGEPLIQDLVLFLNRPDSILLGREFAATRGLHENDVLALVTPAGVHQFTIRGLLDSDGLARVLGGRLVVMDILAAERAFTGDGRVDQIDVVVQPGHSPGEVSHAIANVLPAGVHVEEPAIRKDVIRRTIGGFQAMLAAFGMLAVIAGFVICFSRLGAIFEARTWQVGLMRAVGLRRSAVFAELLKESLLLGAVGTVIGIPLGIAIGRYALPFAATATALNFRTPLAVHDVHVTAWPVALAVAVGLGAAMLAAIVPAQRLARKQPVAALTMRGRAVPQAPAPARWAVRAPLLILALAFAMVQSRLHTAALGHATTALVVVAVCLSAGSLVRRGGRWLAPAWSALFGAVGRLAASQLDQQARRASLTVGTLGLGLGVVLMFGILGKSFERTLVAQVASRLKADLVVTSAFVSGGWVSAPLSDALLDEVRSLDDVAVVAGEQRMDIAYDGGTAVLDAYDPSCFRDPRVCRWPLDRAIPSDPLAAVLHGDGVLVSTAFAYQHRLDAGDVIHIEAPAGVQTFRIAGVTAAEPTAAIILTRTVYSRIWADDLVTWVHVGTRRGTSRDAAQSAIERRVGQTYRVQVRSGVELIDYFASQARQAFSLLYVMEAITFVLVIIAVGDTLASAVAERTRAIGTMRALGLRRRHLFTANMLEGLAIGLLGLLLALVTGIALGAFWVEVQFPAILGWQLDLHVPFSFIGGAVILTLALCVAGALPPALTAAYLPTVHALREE